MTRTLILLAVVSSLLMAQKERHLANIKQLTFGGSNAEAYFSADGSKLVFQATVDKLACDQIFTMSVDGSGRTMVSNGDGRTTCAYWFPDGKRIVYASTDDDDDDCPPEPDRSKGYVWGVFNAYDIYVANADGSRKKVLTASKGYDAEATISPDGREVVFTSTRNGDLDLFIMNADGSNVRQVTKDVGYDGGAFFSPDGKQLVYRAHHPADSASLKEYKDLLKQELVRPTKMELFIINTDGTGKRQLTFNGAANFAPFFTPDGKSIIFSSNLHDPAKFDFELFLIGTDGRNLRRVTFSPGFDGFPMFSPDGKKLVFVSSRNATSRREFNIFLADWAEDSVTSYLRQHEQFLASDALEGRKPGFRGNDIAASYIAQQFASLGLAPVGDNGTFFQNFDVVSELQLGARNTLTAAEKKKRPAVYTPDAQFRPLGFSLDTSVTATPVFAGFGISAPEQKYDDYEGLDVKGKVVVVLRGTPDGDSPHSSFGKFAALRYKAMNARQKGAAAVLVVNPAAEDSADKLIPLRYDNSFSSSGIAALHVKRSVADSWLKGMKLSVDTLAARIYRTKKPVTAVVKNVMLTVSTEVVKVKKSTRNVVGLLKGTGSSGEHIIIGAHFDHLGFGGDGSGSLEPSRNEIHNGADDNASGTASMIEIARYLSERAGSLKRDILFMGFSGEEMGLLGSAHYTKAPLLPLEQAVTMVNLDMVGRLKDRKLTVQGTGTSPSWETMLSSLNADSAFQLAMVKDGFGPSDHASFYSKNVPVLFFFTGVHEDYHKPSDDFDKINYEGMTDIVRYAVRTVVAVDTFSVRPVFQKTAQPAMPSGSGRGFRITMGTVPDYSEGVVGYKISDVRENSPAQKAGMKSGDIIVRIGTYDIKSIYDFMYSLEGFKPGQEADVTVKRGTETLTLKVTFEKRN